MSQLEYLNLLLLSYIPCGNLLTDYIWHYTNYIYIININVSHLESVYGDIYCRWSVVFIK